MRGMTGSGILKITSDQWHSFSEYLTQALDLSESDRALWLAELNVRRPEVAEAIVRALSSRDRGDFSDFLAEPILTPATPPAAATLSGRTVGAYIIEAEIGRGGMGSVWRARRVDDRFEDTVAIKFLHASWIGLEGERRFQSEGRMLGRLDHPNIARLIDAGLLDATHPYLVLEYVEGAAIDVYCETKNLSVEARIAVFLNVLAAVAHAHSHLIVHRDIKPANILVRHDDSVKLLDFGIAKLLDDASGSAALTKSSAAALTPQYAAPEQLLGQPVTTVTDVYSLGLVLYVLLTGRLPIIAESFSRAQLIHAALTDEPPRASAIALDSARRRSLEGDLDNILGKALKKSPGERYASVGAFVDDLKRYLNHEPVKARADTVSYRLAKFVRRHRGGVVSGVLTILVLIGATITTFFQMIEANRQRDTAQFEARRAESSNDFLDLLLLSDDGASQTPLSPAQRIELGARMLELQYRDDPRFAGRMLVELSTQYQGQTATLKAVELDARAYVLGKNAGDPELMALAQCAAAYAETSAGIATRAPERLTEAKQRISQLRTPSIALQVDCRRAEAQLAAQLGNSAMAEQILVGARSLLEQSGQTYRAAYTSVLNDLGGVYNDTGRPAQALAMAKLIGATHEQYGRGGTTARLIALQNESAVLFNIGELRESLKVNEEVQKRREALQGDALAPLSQTVNSAERLIRLGRPQEGIDLARSASTQARSSGNSLWLIFSLSSLCAGYINSGQLPEAELTIQDLKAAINSGSATDPHFRGMLEREQGRLELRRGNAAAALQSANASLVATGAPANGRSRDARAALDLAARAALALGRPLDAERFARQAVGMAEAVARGPETSADVGEALLLLAEAEIAQGRKAEAQPLLERAARCLTNGLGAEHALSREALTLANRNNA
jgi:eukaryotic-like serine/threonine-protein kinase